MGLRSRSQSQLPWIQPSRLRVAVVVMAMVAVGVAVALAVATAVAVAVALAVAVGVGAVGVGVAVAWGGGNSPGPLLPPLHPATTSSENAASVQSMRLTEGGPYCFLQVRSSARFSAELSSRTSVFPSSITNATGHSPVGVR
jgi:hypothetical protein